VSVIDYGRVSRRDQNPDSQVELRGDSELVDDLLIHTTAQMY
jgi:hypothetical protein